MQGVFFFRGCRAERGSGEAIVRAYDFGQNHHALRAWHIVSDFENRCELGKIETPVLNLTVFRRPNCGRRKAPPTDFPPFFQTNLERRLRRRALFFRRGGGANQNAILT